MITNMKKAWVLLCISTLIFPANMQAQKNIQKAFDKLVKDKNVRVDSHLSREKDPATGKLTSQFDYYDIVFPTSQMRKKYVDDIRAAFEKDYNKAYKVRLVLDDEKSQQSRYSAVKTREVLAIGNREPGKGYRVGMLNPSQYIYALFLDPNDKEKEHRYAYILEWNNTKARIGITYAIRQNDGTKVPVTSNYTIRYAEGFPDSIKVVIPEGFDQHRFDSIMKDAQKRFKDFESVSNIWQKSFDKWVKRLEQDTNLTNATALMYCCKTLPKLSAADIQKNIARLESIKKKASDKGTIGVIDDIIQLFRDKLTNGRQTI